jgi:hypothetical protein
MADWVGMIRRRGTIGSIILGIALIVGVVSVFLPWITESSPGGFTLSENGGNVGWGFLYVFVMLNVALFFVARTLAAKRMAMPVADWLLYLCAGVFCFGIALLALSEVGHPPCDRFVNQGVETLVCGHSSVAFGLPLAWAAAIAICAAAFLKRTESRPRGCSPVAAALVVGIVFFWVAVVIILYSSVPRIS